MTKLTQEQLATRIGVSHIDFRVMREPQASLEEDVAVLRASPHFPAGTEIR